MNLHKWFQNLHNFDTHYLEYSLKEAYTLSDSSACFFKHLIVKNCNLSIKHINNINLQ